MVTFGMSLRKEEMRSPPDIFRAAANNNVKELEFALSDGQSLDWMHTDLYRMTPMHIACSRKSVDFLYAAMNEAFNPWVRDSNGRISMDYAVAEGLEDIADRLLERLYPKNSDGRVIMPF